MALRLSWAACAVLSLSILIVVPVEGAGASPRKHGALLSSRREAGKTVLEDTSAAGAEATERAEAQELDVAYYAGAAALSTALRVLESDANSTLANVSLNNATLANVSLNNATARMSRKANLSGELVNLKAVFDSLKKGIVRGNKHEREAVVEDAKNIATIEARIKSGEVELNSTNISAFRRELIVNRTRSDTAELKYWQGHRTNSHGVFHAHLKMAHGMMDRIKTITEVYETVLAGGKVDEKKMKEASWGLPAKKKPIALVSQPDAPDQPIAPKPAKGNEQSSQAAPVKR